MKFLELFGLYGVVALFAAMRNKHQESVDLRDKIEILETRIVELIVDRRDDERKLRDSLLQRSGIQPTYREPEKQELPVKEPVSVQEELAARLEDVGDEEERAFQSAELRRIQVEETVESVRRAHGYMERE